MQTSTTDPTARETLSYPARRDANAALRHLMGQANSHRLTVSEHADRIEIVVDDIHDVIRITFSSGFGGRTRRYATKAICGSNPVRVTFAAAMARAVCMVR